VDRLRTPSGRRSSSLIADRCLVRCKVCNALAALGGAPLGNRPAFRRGIDPHNRRSRDAQQQNQQLEEAGTTTTAIWEYSVNQATLIGRLVATPELREAGSGKSVTTVRVATNGKHHAEFHDVVLWGQLADFACQYLGKGRLVYIEGRLQSRQWQAADSTTRRTIEIIANRLQALSSKSASEAPAA